MMSLSSLLLRISNRLKNMCHYVFIPYTPNPGWNITSVMTLGGFGLMAVSGLLAQLGYGTIDPFIIEIGKAAFYSGLTRAYTKAEYEQKIKTEAEVKSIG